MRPDGAVAATTFNARRSSRHRRRSSTGFRRRGTSLPGGSRFLAADQEPFDREELARQRLTVLRERLLDDEARSLLEKASELQLDLRRATLDEIVVALEKLTDQADRCLRRMGSLARGLW